MIIVSGVRKDSIYELRYYKENLLYKCAVPAGSLCEAIEKLLAQSPELTYNSIINGYDIFNPNVVKL